MRPEIRCVTNLVLGLGVVLLTGCAASTIKEIKADPAATDHFEVAANYQRVHRNLVEKMHECLGSGGGPFAAPQVNQAIYTELKESTITYAMSNVGQHIYLHIDITALSDNRTSVTAYVYFPTWKQHLAKIKPWAIDPAASCSPA